MKEHHVKLLNKEIRVAKTFGYGDKTKNVKHIKRVTHTQ